MHLAKCSYPLVEELGVLITEYSDPTLEGTSVTFGCPSGLVLVGSNTSTCMENGQWNPEPANAACRGVWDFIIIFLVDISFFPFLQLIAKMQYLHDLTNRSSIFWIYNFYTWRITIILFWCENFPSNVFTSLCHRNASWHPSPADIDCSNNVLPGNFMSLSYMDLYVYSVW